MDDFTVESSVFLSAENKNVMTIFSGIRSFNHHAGCQKCSVRGNFSRGVMSFQSTTATLRTDDGFRSRADSEHHIKYSIIEELTDFDVIWNFPISDPLHLLHIGVMKKMLNRWLNGTKFYKKAIPKKKIKEFDDLFEVANLNKPSEINRPIRATKYFARWKATEHRTILLYVGLTILKDFIPLGEYKMFLCLCCAIKLSSVDTYLNGRIDLIDHLLNEFIQKYSQFYGKHTITSNIHNLCHVTADLKLYGNIDSISTYPFENHLGKIKQKIRAYHKPLQQFAKRAGEIEQNENIDINAPKNRIELKFPEGDSFQTILLNEYKLSSRKVGDSWFLLKSAEKIIKFEKAVRINDKILIYGKEIPDKNNFFEYPFESKHIDIYISNCISFDVCTPADIKCKLFRLSYEKMFVFQPLLHTL